MKKIILIILITLPAITWSQGVTFNEELSGSWLICSYYCDFYKLDTLKLEKFNKNVEFEKNCNIGEKNSWIFGKKNKFYLSTVDYRGEQVKSRYIMDNKWEINKKTKELIITKPDNTVIKYSIIQFTPESLILVKRSIKKS